ncbi:MAG: thioredoxin [Chloroflexota bacterium]
MAKLDLLNADQFATQVLKAEGAVLVDFYADWCGPCRMLAPILEDLSVEFAGRLSVVKLDVDANPEVAASFGVQSLPTLLLFRNGTPIQRLVGAMPKAPLKAKLEQALAAAVA